MFKKLSEVIPFKPYQVAAGESFGWRCYDGLQWHECAKDGRILRRD